MYGSIYMKRRESLTYTYLHHHGTLEAFVAVAEECARGVFAGSIATHPMHYVALVNV